MKNLCKNCIIPKDFPAISFSDDVCQFCKATTTSRQLNKKTYGKEKLFKLFSQKKSPYDCLIPISGGKDSSFILYYAVKELHLKPLAFYFRSGMETLESKKNVHNLCQDLQVDCIVKEKSKFRKEIFRHGLLYSLALGRISMTKICKNCENTIRFLAIKTAKEYGIPYILWGSSDFEDPPSSLLQKDDFYRQRYGKKKLFFSLRSEVKNLFSAKHRLKTFYHLFMSSFYTVLDSLNSRFPLFQALNPFLEKDFDDKMVTPIYFFDYVSYDPCHQIATLKKETKWRGAKTREIRMDCKIHAFANLQYLQQMHISCLGFYYSTLVRKKLLSRDQALKLEEKAKLFTLAECRHLAKDMQALKEFEDYLLSRAK